MGTRTPWFTLRRHDEDAPGEPTPTPPAGGETDPKTVTMTQDAINAIIEDRLKRQRAQFSDYDDLKARSARLDEIEQASKSELEREREARAKAETAASEAAKRASERVAAAELKAALTGITDNPGDIIEDLNLARYITAEGDVDADAVAKLREKYAALTKPGTPPPPVRPSGDIDQGRQDGTPTDLRTADRGTLKAELAKYGLRPR